MADQINFAEWLETIPEEDRGQDYSVVFNQATTLVDGMVEGHSIQEKNRVKDMGEYVPGARKDEWALKRMIITDFSWDLSDMQQRNEYIQKKHVWPTSTEYYQSLAKEIPEAYMEKYSTKKEQLKALRINIRYMKMVCDSLPKGPIVQPNASLEAVIEAQKTYIEYVGTIREACEEVVRGERNRDTLIRLLVEKGYIAVDGWWAESNVGDLFNNKVAKNLQVNEYKLNSKVEKEMFLWTDREKKDKLYPIIDLSEEGVSIENRSGRNYLKVSHGRGFSSWTPKDGETVFDWTIKSDSYAVVADARGKHHWETGIIGFNLSKAEAELLQNSKYEVWQDENKQSRKVKKTLLPEPLTQIRMENSVSNRHGLPVGEKDMINDLGLRAVQFGNYMTDKDRQASLDYCYDSFCNLAHVLGVSQRDVSLGNQLAVALGARGRSKAAGHWEPGQNIINITKQRGPGVLGHEWIHALDGYVAVQLGLHSSEGLLMASNSINDPNTPDSIKVLMNVIKYKEDGSFTDFYKNAQTMDGQYSKAGNGYWASSEELLARAGHSYLRDKCAEMGIVDDYLTGHSEMSAQIIENVHQSPQILSLSPVGDERSKINQAFDSMFVELQNIGLLTSEKAVDFVHDYLADNYGYSEADIREDMSDRSAIGVQWGTTKDEEHEILIQVNLKELAIETYVDDEFFYSICADNVADFVDQHLNSLNVEDYVKKAENLWLEREGADLDER